MQTIILGKSLFIVSSTRCTVPQQQQASNNHRPSSADATSCTARFSRKCEMAANSSICVFCPQSRCAIKHPLIILSVTAFSEPKSRCGRLSIRPKTSPPSNNLKAVPPLCLLITMTFHHSSNILPNSIRKSSSTATTYYARRNRAETAISRYRAGPCSPKEAGISVAAAPFRRQAADYGIASGHQTIGEAFSGIVDKNADAWFP